MEKKPLKLNKKLQLNKETIARLTNDEQSSIYGGADVPNESGVGPCYSMGGADCYSQGGGGADCTTSFVNCPPLKPEPKPLNTFDSPCVTPKTMPSPLGFC